MKKLLVVEDDKALGFVIKDNLQKEGFDVDLIPDGELGLKGFFKKDYDVVILDVMLPKLDGFSIAEKIREVNTSVPILFLSAKSLIEDRLEGLRKGGDDYLTKPFSMEELLLKISIFLKRSSGGYQNDVFTLGNYTFMPDSFTLSINGNSVKLTQKEAQLLAMLVRKKGVVLKREEILTEVWGNDDYFLGRSMDVFISKLRKYLKADPTISITNYHGVGFRLEVNN